MVAKSQLKLIKKLHQKKYRTENNLFFVEGIKVVDELLSASYTPFLVLAIGDYMNHFSRTCEVQEISAQDLAKISALKSPNGVLGVFYQPKFEPIALNDWVVVLDTVQDPGNLGTIIRLCDWYGVRHLVCSTNTVDCYNPKVLQATMGSIARLNVHYVDVEPFLKESNKTVYGAFMDGDSVYDENFDEPGILVMGNEANGISESLKKYISKKVTIPQFGAASAESLNVAMATGILLNEIRRR